MKKSNKPIIKRGDVKDAILSAIAIAGVMAIAMCAPSALQLLDPWRIKKWQKKKGLPKYVITRSLKKLIEQGLVEYTDNSHQEIRVSTKGEHFLDQIRMEDIRFKRPKRWDEKWRVVIFDVKEDERRKRDGLRKLLQRIGFLKLQQSVWIFPYHCEDLVTLLKTSQGLGKDVIYMVVETVENDVLLKKNFEI